MKNFREIIIVLLICYLPKSTFPKSTYIVIHDDLKSTTTKSNSKNRRKVSSSIHLIDTDTVFNCKFINKYSVAYCLKQYPFVKSKEILIISYHGIPRKSPVSFEEPDKIIDSTGKIIYKYKPYVDTVDGEKYGLHINKGRLNHKSIIEIKTLNSKQIRQLIKLIYNTSYKDLNWIQGLPSDHPFNPGNAILFIDQSGKIFDYVEIDFENGYYESHSQRISIGNNCNQIYNYLKRLFVDAGVND